MLSIGWERIFAGFRDTGEGTRQQRLREALVAAIEDGRLSAGTRLPSSRTLANLLRISRNTVVQALDQLVESGHLTARLRSGLFVAQRDMAEPAETARPIAPAASESAWERSFAIQPSRLRHISKPADWHRYPFPFLFGQTDPSLFPTREWRESARATSSVGGVSLWASDRIDEDDPKLIEQLRAQVLPQRGIWARPEEVMITLGAQQALSLVIRLFTGPSTVFGIEDPCYPDARHMAALLTPHLRLLRMDRHGAVADETLAGCDVVMLTPARQCPTTVAMPLERQLEVLRVASGRGTVVIEDDYDGGLFDEGRASGCLRSHDPRVIHIGSFSKLIAPGLRIGYVVAPARVIEELRAVRRLELRHPPLNNQRTLANFIALGHYRAHRHRLGSVMVERARLIDRSLANDLPELLCRRTPGSTGAWLELPSHLTAAAVTARARRDGVLIEPGDVFFADPGVQRSHLRLGFTSIPADRIEAGISTLARLLHDAPGRADSRDRPPADHPARIRSAHPGA